MWLRKGLFTDPCERNLALAFRESLISLLTAGTTIAMRSLHETITLNADIFVFLPLEGCTPPSQWQLRGCSASSLRFQQWQ